jgi:hypothetical protein
MFTSILVAPKLRKGDGTTLLRGSKIPLFHIKYMHGLFVKGKIFIEK